jgi:hypothetical protein
VQRVGTWSHQLRGKGANANSRLVTEAPHAFRARLRACVAAAVPLGADAPLLARLAARDARVVAVTPDFLTSRLRALAAFFTPHGDAPAPQSARTADSRLEGLTRVQAALLSRTDLLFVTESGLAALVRQLVAVGVFESDAQARKACMHDPRLLKCVSWRKLVQVRAVLWLG